MAKPASLAADFLTQATTPTASKGPAATAPAFSPAGKEGQSFAERKAKGRVKLEAWVDGELKDKVTALTAKLGFKFPKQTLVKALEELAAKYGM